MQIYYKHVYIHRCKPSLYPDRTALSGYRVRDAFYVPCYRLLGLSRQLSIARIASKRDKDIYIYQIYSPILSFLITDMNNILVI